MIFDTTMMKRLLLAFALLSAPLFAATSSTITVSGNSATVTTSTAHGLSLNQGVCLKSTLPGDSCGVVTAVGSSTQFTALLSTAINACASSCGTALAAPQVIIMPTSSPTQGFTTWSWLNWVTTQQPCPSSASSAWIAANGSLGATAAEKSALQSGLLIEHSRTLVLASSTPIATVEALIQGDYASDQAAAPSPCQFYGFTWDPTSNAWAKQ